MFAVGAPLPTGVRHGRSSGWRGAPRTIHHGLTCRRTIPNVSIIDTNDIRYALLADQPEDAMTSTTTPTVLSRADRIGMYGTIAVAAAAAAATTWGAVARLAEVIPGRDVPVLVPFLGETAPLPIGPDGAPIDVQVEQAIVTVPRPAPATQFALVAEPIVHGLAIVAGIALLALLCWNLARGRAFARANVRIVFWGAGVLTAGWFLGSLLTTMTVNGALSAVSDYGYDGITFSTNWAVPFAILAIAAVGAAFQVGERLQRDTEGLV